MSTTLMPVLGIFLVSLILAAGCTGTGSSPSPLPAITGTVVLTTAPSPTPQPAIPAANVTIMPANVTTVPIPKPTPTPTAPPDPDDLPAITFAHYADQDIAFDYPSSWNTSRKSPVYFTSADKRIAFAAGVIRLKDYQVCVYKMNTSIEGSQAVVKREQPKYDPKDILYDFALASKNSVPLITYSVKLPDNSLSYTRYSMVTMHKAFQFTFSADTAAFENHPHLREYMLNSISVSDAV